MRGTSAFVYDVTDDSFNLVGSLEDNILHAACIPLTLANDRKVILCTGGRNTVNTNLGKTYVYDIVDNSWARKSDWDLDPVVTGAVIFLYDVEGMVMTDAGYAFVEGAASGQNWQLQDRVVGGSFRIHFKMRHLMT